MALTLTPEQESRLQAYAATKQKPIEIVLDELIPPPPIETGERLQTGKELIASLRAKGLLGSYGDPNIDSVELARRIRREAEQRVNDNA